MTFAAGNCGSETMSGNQESEFASLLGPDTKVAIPALLRSYHSVLEVTSEEVSEVWKRNRLDIITSSDNSEANRAIIEALTTLTY
jgi:hypothetical protein